LQRTRLLRPQPGLRAPSRWARVRGARPHPDAPPDEPVAAELHPRLARGRLRAQGGTRRHRTDRRREDRRHGVAAAACSAPPLPLPAAVADGSVARVLVQIPDPRPTGSATTAPTRAPPAASARRSPPPPSHPPRTRHHRPLSLSEPPQDKPPPVREVLRVARAGGGLGRAGRWA
jgi:hypothetical protein